MPRRPDLRARWLDQIDRLHGFPMGSQYRAAMVASTGDFDNEHHADFNNERDADFAMQVLRPQVVDLLNRHDQVDVEALLSIPWIDSKNPGVYGCLGRKYDSEGRLVQSILKVGCAWSEASGLHTRRVSHENVKSSQHAADNGSRFHIFRRGIQDDEIVHYHWFTLAMGQRFRRGNAVDEWKAAIYYQIESILSAALGAQTESVCRDEFVEMSGWPWDNPTSRPWDGVDAHCAIEDRWVLRSKETAEEAKHRHKLTRDARFSRNTNQGLHCCPLPNCDRHNDSFQCATALVGHMARHDKVGKLPDRVCFDERCGHWVKGSDGEEMDRHEERHLKGDFSCGACGLEFTEPQYATKHANSRCKVPDSVALHAKKNSIGGWLPCSNDLCDFKSPANGLGAHKRLANHERTHVNGKSKCGKCGLILRSQPQLARHMPACTMSDAVDLNPDRIIKCPDDRCYYTLARTESHGQGAYDDHVAGHADGKLVCPTCGLRFRTEGALRDRNHPARCLNMSTTGEPLRTKKAGTTKATKSFPARGEFTDGHSRWLRKSRKGKKDT